MSLGSSVEEEDSPLVFLEKVHMLRERVEEFMKTPLPSVINLSVSPRAADFLEQRWTAVTIRSLEDAPIPKVSCCSRCSGGSEAAAAPEAGGDRSDVWCELQPTSSVVLLGLLLLLAVLWVNPVGGASLGFSLLSRFSQVVHGLSSDLITSVWDAVGSAYTTVELVVERWSTQLSSVGEQGFEQLAALFKTLTSQ